MLKNITDKIYALNDAERMDKANELYYEAVEYLKGLDPIKYQELERRAEDLYYTMDIPEAEEIVRHMIPSGERWTYEQVKHYVCSQGIEKDYVCYYLAMNMAFNDYRRTAEAFGHDTEDFYFHIAYDFVNDPDGTPHKIAKYFKM